jgi:hypothetical protein
MGTTYRYANLTKREWFDADALGGSSKAGGLGLSLTARAFDLLLVSGHPHAPSRGVSWGRWARDSIALIGDADDEWPRYREEFADIGADVILMLYARDGFERIGSAAEEDPELFMELCHLVVTRQALQLEPHMKERFGANFRQRYKKLCEERGGFKPKDVVFAEGG